MTIDEINLALNLKVMVEVERRAHEWLVAARGADWTEQFEEQERLIIRLNAENSKLREALERVVKMTRETPCLPDGVIQQARDVVSERENSKWKSDTRMKAER